MRDLGHRRTGLGMLRANRPRQRSSPCARYLVSGSAHSTVPMPARAGSDVSLTSVQGRAWPTTI